MCYPPPTNRPVARNDCKTRGEVSCATNFGDFRIAHRIFGEGTGAQGCDGYYRRAMSRRSSKARLRIATAIGPSAWSTPEATTSACLAFFARRAPPSPRPCTKRNAAETYIMLDGAGVLVTGGTLKAPVNPAPVDSRKLDRSRQQRHRGRRFAPALQGRRGHHPRRRAARLGERRRRHYVPDRAVRSREENRIEVAGSGIASLIGKWPSE